MSTILYHPHYSMMNNIHIHTVWRLQRCMNVLPFCSLILSYKHDAHNHNIIVRFNWTNCAADMYMHLSIVGTPGFNLLRLELFYSFLGRRPISIWQHTSASLSLLITSNTNMMNKAFGRWSQLLDALHQFTTLGNCLDKTSLSGIRHVHYYSYDLWAISEHN